MPPCGGAGQRRCIARSCSTQSCSDPVGPVPPPSGRWRCSQPTSLPQLTHCHTLQSGVRCSKRLPAKHWQPLKLAVKFQGTWKHNIIMILAHTLWPHSTSRMVQRFLNSCGILPSKTDEESLLRISCTYRLDETAKQSQFHERSNPSLLWCDRQQWHTQPCSSKNKAANAGATEAHGTPVIAGKTRLNSRRPVSWKTDKNHHCSCQR